MCRWTREDFIQRFECLGEIVTQQSRSCCMPPLPGFMVHHETGYRTGYLLPAPIASSSFFKLLFLTRSSTAASAFSWRSSTALTFAAPLASAAALASARACELYACVG